MALCRGSFCWVTFYYVSFCFKPLSEWHSSECHFNVYECVIFFWCVTFHWVAFCINSCFWVTLSCRSFYWVWISKVSFSWTTFYWVSHFWVWIKNVILLSDILPSVILLQTIFLKTFDCKSFCWVWICQMSFSSVKYYFFDMRQSVNPCFWVTFNWMPF